MAESTIETSAICPIQTEEAPIKILHVDDELGLLKVSKQILENECRFEVDSASSVEDAMVKMKANTYDAIVSDYQMPEKDGLQFLKELRDAGNQIPFVIFTGKGREEVAIRALNLGADRYLNKVGDPETVYGELGHTIWKTVKSKRAEKIQEVVQRRLENVFTASPDAITVTDLNGTIVDCNDATLELYGFNSKEEVIGKNSIEFIAKCDQERAMENLKKSLEYGSTKNLEYISQKSDGQRFAVEISASVIKDINGSLLGFVGITKDITERKRAEEILRASEEKYRSLFENAKDVIVLMDSKGKVTSVNKTAIEYGFKKDDIIGKSMYKFVTKKHWSKLLKDLVQLSRGKSTSGILEIITPKGMKNVEYNSSPIIVKGKAVGIQAILRDFTERKKSEKFLRESKEKLRSHLDAIPDLIVSFDNKGFITAINSAIEKSGYRKEEFIGKHILRSPLANGIEKRNATRLFRSLIAGKLIEPFEIQWRSRDGKSHISQATISAIKVNQKVIGYIAITRDITSRKQAEKKSQESQTTLKVALEESPIGIVSLGLKGDVKLVNKEFERITGYRREDVLGKNWFSLVRDLNALSSETLDIIKKRIRMRLMGKPPIPTRFRLKRRDGQWIWVESRSRAKIRKIGLPVSLEAVINDVTELVEAENALKHSNKKLEILNEKLTVVGGLSRHDIRNKLSTVLGRIFLANQKLGENPEAQRDLVEAQRVVHEVERILDFAREYESLGREELVFASVGDNVKSAVSLLPMAGAELEGVKIVERCDGVQILADSMLQQLFYNLVDNSLKHGENVNQIKMYYKAEKNGLKLIYEDNGVGVSKAEKEKIFEKGYGKGTGYGLYLIKKMCEIYGWTIKETGKEGKGAQFTMTIPKLDEQGKPNYKLN